MSNDWPMVALGELLIKSEKWIEIFPDRVYRQVTVKLWGKGVIERGELSGASIAASKQLCIETYQFILSKIDARNGAFGLVPSFLEGAIVSADFPVFSLNTARILPKYLEWMSKTSAFVDLCGLASEGTTNRVRLQESRFLASMIALPSLEEQRRIVARIEELAGKVEEARGRRGKAKEQTENLVDAARSGIFAIALKKEVASLEEVASLARGKFSYRPRNDPRFFGGEHPWIQIAEIEASGKYIQTWSQTLNDEGLAVSRKFPKGTLLISIAATIGSLGILNFDCCIPDSIVAITPKQNVSSEYLYHYLSYLRGHLEQIAPQSAQKNINLEILSSLPCPCLPTIEQARVVAYLDDLQAKIDAIKRYQARTQSELDGLLPSILDKAFRGELV